MRQNTTEDSASCVEQRASNHAGERVHAHTRRGKGRAVTSTPCHLAAPLGTAATGVRCPNRPRLLGAPLTVSTGESYSASELSVPPVKGHAGLTGPSTDLMGGDKGTCKPPESAGCVVRCQRVLGVSSPAVCPQESCPVTLGFTFSLKNENKDIEVPFPAYFGDLSPRRNGELTL